MAIRPIAAAELALALALAPACSKKPAHDEAARSSATAPGSAATGVPAATGSVDPGTLGDRFQHVAAALADGRVLVAGGDLKGAMATAFVFDPSHMTFTAAASMHAPHVRAAAVTLGDGRVLVAGGVDDKGELAKADVWAPATAVWSDAGDMPIAVQDLRMVALKDGRALVVGGRGFSFISEQALLWDAKTGRWTTTGQLAAPRYDHALAILGDGRVLAAGGATEPDDSTAASEVYDPAKGTWARTAPLAMPRAQACAATLTDGRVLVAGGGSVAKGLPGESLASAELYDPAKGTWSPAGKLAFARSACVLVALPGGQALAVGGYRFGGHGDYVAELELFDGSRWTSKGVLEHGRSDHTATLTGDGRILVVGGRAHDDGVPSPELINLAAR